MENSHISRSSSDPISQNFDVGTSAGTTETPQTTPVRPTKEATPSDFQVQEGTDVLGGETVTQQFSARGPKDTYFADSSRPALLEPKPEWQAELQPYESDVQLAIKRDFTNRIREKLKEKAKESSTASAIASGEAPLTKETKEKDTGKPVASKDRSTKGAKEKEEEDRPELPPAQLEKEVIIIVESVRKGNIEMLSESQKKVAIEATQETQKAWGLPASWSISSSQKLDWTPIKKVAPPVNPEAARREFLAANMKEFLEGLENAGKKVVDSLGQTMKTGSDSLRQRLGDFVEVIAQAIRELKAILQELKVKESDKSIEMSKGKFEEIEARTKAIERQEAKNKEIYEKREKQEQTAKTTKWVAVSVSILVTIIGVIALPFTAGASTALIIAGIAIAAVTTAYTIIDATLNVTEKLMTAFNKCLEGAFPGEENKWKRTLIKALIVAVVVAVIVAAIVFSGGGAAASVAAQTAAKVIKDLGIQAIMTLVMSSNVIPELFSTALIESGILNRNDKEGKMYAEIAMMALTALIGMFAIATGGKNIGSAIKSIGKGISEGAKAVGDAVSKAAHAMLDMLKSLPKTLSSISIESQQIIDALMRMLKALLAPLKDIGRSVASFVTDFKNITDRKEIAGVVLEKLSTLLKLAGLSTEVATGIIVGVLGLEISKLLKDLGAIEKAEELIQMLIKLFDKLLNSLQDNLGKMAEWTKSLQQALNSTYATKEQISAKAAHVQG